MQGGVPQGWEPLLYHSTAKLTEHCLEEKVVKRLVVKQLYNQFILHKLNPAGFSFEQEDMLLFIKYELNEFIKSI